MKEELYHVVLDDYEQGIILRCLNDKKTELMKAGKYTDAIDDVLVKIGTAPKKRFKVVAKDSRDEPR